MNPELRSKYFGVSIAKDHHQKKSPGVNKVVLV
jgi:hypothetical protein